MTLGDLTKNRQSHLLTDFTVWTTVKIEQKGKGVIASGF